MHILRFVSFKLTCLNCPFSIAVPIIKNSQETLPGETLCNLIFRPRAKGKKKSLCFILSVVYKLLLHVSYGPLFFPFFILVFYIIIYSKG